MAMRRDSSRRHDRWRRVAGLDFRCALIPSDRTEAPKAMENELGSRLVQARESRRLSQEAVAGLLGVSRVLVSHWERGERQPSAQVLERLAEIYGVTLG